MIETIEWVVIALGLIVISFVISYFIEGGL